MSQVDGPRSVPKTGTILGEMAAVLPDPLSLFEARSRRLAALASGHRLEPYLLFLAEVTHAQHDVAHVPQGARDADGHTEPTDDLAQRALLAAGLQVHFARLAQLRADDLKLVADGACPVCGSPPMTSTVVDWPKAHNTRFCTCPLCAVMWNVVRVKCLMCGSTEGISFREIEGNAAVKAETCEKCRGYVKILYQVNDPSLDSMADDVASLGLDMLLAEEGWKRGGRNPFLLGY